MMQSTPIILRIIVLFFVVVFFWAIVGMELFGGYVSDESPCELLRLTPWCVAHTKKSTTVRLFHFIHIAAVEPCSFARRDTPV